MPRKDAQPGAKEKAAARRQLVLDYRKAGLTFRQIADRLSAKEGETISYQQIHRDYKKVMKEVVIATRATKEEMVGLMEERLEMVCVAVAPRVAKGEVGAAKIWIKANESFRKLHGLDKPVQVEEPPLERPKLDYSKLSVMELRLLEQLVLKATPTNGEVAGDDSNDEEDDD